MDKGAKLLQELRAIPPRQLAGVFASHALLLVAVWWAQLPYLVVQVLVAVEVLLMSLATIPLYPERGILRHLGDALKMFAGLVFVLFFVVITYGVAAAGREGEPLGAGIEGLARIAEPASRWGLVYVVAHLAVAALHARSTPDPRATWARTQLMEGAATFLSLFFMVFLAAFAGVPIVHGLRSVGVDVDVDAVLGTLMVLIRTFFALVCQTFTEAEKDAVARNPYAT